jgi:hypothetical protein
MVILDKATKKYGPKPTPQQVSEMAKFRGITYQRGGNKSQDKSQTSAPKVSSNPLKSNMPINAGLNFDLGGWLSNAKVLVPVSKIMKIPSWKEKLLKAIEQPPKSVVEKQSAMAY